MTIPKRNPTKSIRTKFPNTYPLRNAVFSIFQDTSYEEDSSVIVDIDWEE
jgi:hypothetical protein